MKKILIIITVLLNSTIIMSQTEFDALKYVQTDINGTARYLGMAGAFGALGGDASSIKDNPAGLGIFRSSEVSGSVNVKMQSTQSTWNDVANKSLSPYNMGFQNFSLIISNPTWRQTSGTNGLLNSNWSFGYNRLKDFKRNLNIKSGDSNTSLTDYICSVTNGFNESGFDEKNNPFANLPWISVLAYQSYLINPVGGNNWQSVLKEGQKVKPTFYLSESGYIDEYAFGWAGNYNNKFYIGATLNIQSIDYTAKSIHSELYSNADKMSLTSTIVSRGSGANLNIGTIYRPNDFLRLGLSLQTPTLLSIEDKYFATLEANIDSITVKHGQIKEQNTPDDGSNNFKVQGPVKINLSAALIIGKKGLVSAEYDYSNNKGTILTTETGETKAYDLENQRMKTNLNNSRTIKIGGEYKYNENLAFRAGFANTNNTTVAGSRKIMYEYTVRTDQENFLHNSTNYLTAGIGYREASWFIDFAYVHKVLDQTFTPYDINKVATASVITTSDNLTFTLGFKF